MIRTFTIPRNCCTLHSGHFVILLRLSSVFLLAHFSSQSDAKPSDTENYPKRISIIYCGWGSERHSIQHHVVIQTTLFLRPIYSLIIRVLIIPAHSQIHYFLRRSIFWLSPSLWLVLARSPSAPTLCISLASTPTTLSRRPTDATGNFHLKSASPFICNPTYILHIWQKYIFPAFPDRGCVI